MGLKITEVNSYVVESDETLIRIDYSPENITKARIHIKNKGQRNDFAFLDVREAVSRFADKFAMDFADCTPPSETTGTEDPAPGYVSSPPSDEEYIAQQDEEVEEQDPPF